ncbi:hypothetical protein QYG89_03525 [Bacillus sp. B190/17]|uniref:YfhD family protein n=1 Tax=Bacillus lumedeiriae TaxID=3058829 RepID=A0ABW8I6C1_9BACI
MNKEKNFNRKNRKKELNTDNLNVEFAQENDAQFLDNNIRNNRKKNNLNNR